jgi:hypothetical protein
MGMRVCLLMVGGWWLLLGTGSAWAQLATMRGRVLEAETGQPLAGATLWLAGERGETGTATNADGVFVFTRLTPGTYRLTATFLGFGGVTDTLEVAFAQALYHEFRLASLPQEIDEVMVEAESHVAETGVPVGLETVRPSALARVPMPDVTRDLAGFLLTLPGVVTTGDRGGQLFIRGGTPTQNLVQVDGMVIYQPFHIVGFYSAIPADLLAYADVYAGGFGARYGGRISSVIDVNTRNGNKRRLVGAAAVAPFLSSARLEVPLARDKVSLLASARESIIERVAPDLLGQRLPFRFGDRFLKFHAFLNQTSSVSLTALHTFDEGDIAALDSLARPSQWRNTAWGGRYHYLAPDYPVVAQVAFYTTRFDSRYQPEVQRERRALAREVHGALNFIYLLGASQVHFGIFATTSRYGYNLGGQDLDLVRENVTSGGGYFDAQLAPHPDWRIEPGIRIETFSNMAQLPLGPRLRVGWHPGGANGRQQVSAAAGLYHQQIVGLNNEQDVTEAFTVWAPSPPNTPIPKARHLIVGTQRRLGKGLTLGTEGYLKHIEDLSFPEFDEAGSAVSGFARVDGTVQGLELQAEWSQPGFFGTVSYTLGTVTYTVREGGRIGRLPSSFHPPHDRRHQVNVLCRLERGALALNTRWQFGSGLPFTQIFGYFDKVPVQSPDDDHHHTAPGLLQVSRATPYATRLPAYHRLDVSVERVIRFRGGKATVQVSVINTYDRANIFDYNFFTAQRINQMPLIPSLGIQVEVL